LAELEWCNENQNFINPDGTLDIKNMPRMEENRLFKGWVYRWLNEDIADKNYSEAELFAIRCSLVHSYGWSRQMDKASLSQFQLTHRQPENHCKWRSRDGFNYYWLNFENLAADFLFAADACIEQMKPNINDGFLNYVKALVAPWRFDIEGNRVVNRDRVSLHFVDSRLSSRPLGISKPELLEKIRALYRGELLLQKAGNQ
jgi:hypothetical protein